MSREFDGTSLARLAREALIGANVHSPSIIRVVDVGIAREGFSFMVMELLASRPLGDSKALYGDVAWGVPMLAEVARAIAVVHAAGIVDTLDRGSNPGCTAFSCDES